MRFTRPERPSPTRSAQGTSTRCDRRATGPHALRAVDFLGGRDQHLAERRRAHGSTEAESSGMSVYAHELSTT